MRDARVNSFITKCMHNPSIVESSRGCQNVERSIGCKDCRQPKLASLQTAVENLNEL